MSQTGNDFGETAVPSEMVGTQHVLVSTGCIKNVILEGTWSELVERSHKVVPGGRWVI